MNAKAYFISLYKVHLGGHGCLCFEVDLDCLQHPHILDPYCQRPDTIEITRDSDNH